MTKKVYGLKRATPKMKFHHMNFMMEWKANLRDHQEEQREKAARLRGATVQTCQSIADRLTPDEYTSWWDTTPDDNEGFYRAAQDKLSELETAEILEWLAPSPADYDAIDPAALRQSEDVSASIAANWDSIPEVEL